MESQYIHEDTACLYIKLDPQQGPFLVVPSLSEQDIPGKFDLTIFSSSQVQMVKLEDSKNVAHAAEWNEEAGTAGGCHLYDKKFEKNNQICTWINNPQFLLQFPEQIPVKCKITLNRPEKIWKKRLAKNTVGCMMGIYVLDYASVGYGAKDKKILNDDLCFKPMNQVSITWAPEHPDPQGYIIMPCTYERNMFGPFVISVTSEYKFTFEHINET